VTTRKLPLPMFSAKTRASESDLSTHYLHFISSVRLDKNQYTFVCEGQPLMTFRSHGLPGRCPACGARIHPEAYSGTF